MIFRPIMILTLTYPTRQWHCNPSHDSPRKCRSWIRAIWVFPWMRCSQSCCCCCWCYCCECCWDYDCWRWNDVAGQGSCCCCRCYCCCYDVATAAAAAAALTGQQWDGRWCHRIAADRWEIVLGPMMWLTRQQIALLTQSERDNDKKNSQNGYLNSRERWKKKLKLKKYGKSLRAASLTI